MNPTARECELKAGLEHLLGIEHQEADGHRRQYVQGAPLAREVGGKGEQRESRRAAHAGRSPSGHQRIKPQQRRGDEQGSLAPHEAEPQHQHQERGQHHRVRAGNHDCVIGAGVAELLRPNALHLVGFADHDSLHHAGLIRLALVEMREALEGHHAEAYDGGLEARSALAWQNSDLGAGAHGGGPIDVAARQIARVVERAGIAEIARTAHAGLELHALAVS
jgi:mannose-6-phosphate isomerase-like protein (cupin superfamily)